MRRFFRDNPIIILFFLLLAAQSFMNGNFQNPVDWFMGKLMILPAIIIGISFHEFAHAIAAYKLGDQTPKQQGRVTINPIAHIDPIGFLALFFIGFGWGKPVMVNPTNFKSQRRDGLIVDIAGVTVNLILAVLFAGIVKLLYVWNAEFFSFSYMGGVIIEMIVNIVWINIILMIFNLLPVPPLDGFGIVTEVFNLREKEIYYRIYDKGFIFLMILILFNITDKILGPAAGFAYQAIFGIFGLV